MKVTIRVQSPQLARFFRPGRIQRLPSFARCTKSRKKHAAPFIVWARSIAVVAACVCLAMIASLDSSELSGLGHVGDSLVERMSATADQPPALPRPPEASFPYGSVPPLQSQVAPLSRQPIALASQ